MADQTVEDYLRSWGLGAYIEKFKEQAIDLNALLNLTENDVKELIPIVGHRTLFKTNTNALKNVINPVITIPSFDSPSTSTSVNDVCIQNLPLLTDTPESLQDQSSNDLHNLLSSSNEGRALLLQFESKGLLDNSARRRLCNIIINKELRGYPDKSISSKRFYELAYEIPKVFDKESAAVYFTPYVCFGPTQKTAAKGKLLDTYRQRRKEFAKSGLIATRKRRSSSGSSCSAPASPSSQSRDAIQRLPDESEKDYMLWLKNSSDPWMTVQLYWDLTRKARLQKYADTGMSIAEYFSDYRALGQSGGLYLLLDDFNSLYPDCRDRLFENWPLYRGNIIGLARTRTDPAVKNILTSCDASTDEDVLNMVAFLCLPYLMNTSTLRKPKTQKQWRPSKIESQQGFIMHVTSSADLEASITLRKEKMTNLGFTVQPFIVIIGPSLKQIHTRYIIVNNVKYSPTTDIRYNSTSIIHAVDSCFKILFALNAEYPAESAYIWTFIQKALYKVTTKYDKVFTTVNAFMTDLGIIS